MMHQIGRKLKEQLQRFSGELSVGLGKVASRFVEEMIYGITASGSVHLTQVARSLEEDIKLHATHKRLSERLDEEGLGERVTANLLRLGAPRIKRDTLLIVDPFGHHQKVRRENGISGRGAGRERGDVVQRLLAVRGGGLRGERKGDRPSVATVVVAGGA